MNVLKLGSVSFGNYSIGAKVASPVTESDEANANDNSKVSKNTLHTENSNNPIQAVESDIEQNNSNNTDNSSTNSSGALENGQINGENVTVTINYNDNRELPGFNANEGYRSPPPDIGQFNNALLIPNISLGYNYANFQTRKVFIRKKGYSSTFSLAPNQAEQTRVGFSLEAPGILPKAVFLQLGLQNLSAGTTTLTYLVSIFGDGEILWSNQIKYEESQIASVVLDIEGYNDIVIEYQVVESGGIPSYKLDERPLFFTEAKLLS